MAGWDAAGEMRVSVCVITYRRPEGLRRLLESLGVLSFERSEAPHLEVVVVDNDAAGSARAVCEGMATGYPWRLRYQVEPRRGIPYARNTAVALAGDVADLVAFLDDDEVADPLWLDELLRVREFHGADVVAGPALPYFEEKPPGWVLKGRFFERTRFATGSPLKPVFVATNNVLVRSGVLRKLAPNGEVFDERFAMSGGSDTHLFMRVRKAGYEMVWADGAVVHDRIPASRANARWILQRGYRFGNTLALCERDLDPSVRTRLLRLAKSGKQVVQGLMLVPLSPILGYHALVKGGRHVCRGLGMLAGMMGLRYEEYRKTHGA